MKVVIGASTVPLPGLESGPQSTAAHTKMSLLILCLVLFNCAHLNATTTHVDRLLFEVEGSRY